MLNQILQKPPHTHIDTYIDAKQVVPFVIYLAKLCQSQAMHEILHTNYGRKCRKRRHRLANQVGQTIQYIHTYMYILDISICLCVCVCLCGCVGWSGYTSKFIWHGDGTPCIMLCPRTSELSEYFWGRLYKVTVLA